VAPQLIASVPQVAAATTAEGHNAGGMKAMRLAVPMSRAPLVTRTVPEPHNSKHVHTHTTNIKAILASTTAIQQQKQQQQQLRNRYSNSCSNNNSNYNTNGKHNRRNSNSNNNNNSINNISLYSQSLHNPKGVGG
jgi:hypothetical protein